MIERYKSALVYLLAAILFCRILQYSWVTDDAFITFRSVMNLIAGDGPVFNIGERVQSYTHPLWFILLSFGGWLDLNLYFFSIFAGLLFSLLTILALFRLNRDLGNKGGAMLMIVFGYLAASESFISFGTSGLENALTYFLVVLTVIASLDPLKRLPFYLFASLALLNRFDTIFLLVPLVGWITYSDWKNRKFHFKAILLGALPLVIWHLFSLVYYGFLFPNTKYAKIGGRPLVENATSGFYYLIDSMQSEWHVWLLVFTLPLLVSLSMRSRLVAIVHSKTLLAIFAGVYLQIAYVVFISGGDFMRGRFFTTVTLASAIMLLFFRLSVSQLAKWVLAISSISFFVMSAWLGAKEHLLWMVPGVANERNFYKQTLGLNLDPYKNYTNHPWAQQARELASSNDGIVGVNGQRGYWIPRHVNLIDTAALTDAFIARSPIVDSARTGHFVHKIPEEYLITKTQHRIIPDWQDKEAQTLYVNVAKVTESAELFSVERLKAMLWLWRRYGM